MSRLWDSNAIYVRTEVDELLRDYPSWSVSQLADAFEQSLHAYEGDPEFAREIAGELRKRAAAEIRFWPEPPGLDIIAAEVRAIVSHAAAALTVAETDQESGYWWQRM